MNSNISTASPGPRSLMSMCQAVAKKNIDDISDFGSLPFEVISPILKNVRHPFQLGQIIVQSPQIAAERAGLEVLWKHLLQKFFPKWEQKWQRIIEKTQHWQVLWKEVLTKKEDVRDSYEELLDAKRSLQEEHPEIKIDLSFLKMYSVLRNEEDKIIAQATAKLGKNLAAIDEERKSNLSRIVSASAAPSTPGRRKQKGNPFGHRPNLTSGQAMMRQLKRETATKTKATSIAALKAQATPTKLKEAPKGLINEYRIAQNPVVRIRAPMRKSKARMEMDDKEARLLAIKRQSAPAAPVPSSTSNSTKRAPSHDEKDALRGPPVKRFRPDGNFSSSSTAEKMPSRRGSLLSSAYRSDHDSHPRTKPTSKRPVDEESAKSVATRPRSETRSNRTGLDPEHKATSSKTRGDATRPRSQPQTHRYLDASNLSPEVLPAKREPTSPTKLSPAAPSLGRPLRQSASPQSQVPKKKSVDIFMRPKKRVH